VVFGKKEGLCPSNSIDDEPEDDDLALMKKQYEMRIAAACRQVCSLPYNFVTTNSDTQAESVNSPPRNGVSPAASPSPPSIPGPSSNTMVNATDLDVNTSRKRSEWDIDDGNSTADGIPEAPPPRKQTKDAGGSRDGATASKRKRKNN